MVERPSFKFSGRIVAEAGAEAGEGAFGEFGRTATAEPRIAEPRIAEPRIAEPRIAEPRILL